MSNYDQFKQAYLAIRPDADETEVKRGFATEGLGVGEAFTKGAQAGFYQTLGGFGTLGEMAGLGTGDWAEKQYQQAEQYGLPPELQGYVWDNPDLLANPAWLAYQTGQVFPSIATTMVPGALAAKGASALGAGARAAGLAGGAASGLMGGAQEAAGTYRQTGDMGEALTFGAISAGLNAVPAAQLFGPVGRFGIPGKVAASALGEGVTEWAEEPAEALVTGEDPWEAAKQGLNVVPGAVLSGLLLGGGGAAAHSYGKHAKKLADEAGMDIISLQNALGPMMTATEQMAQGQAPAIFAGQKSKTADLESLKEAEKLSTTGKSLETIRGATGWYKWVDDKWRYEISDDTSAIKKPFPTKGQRWGDIHNAVEGYPSLGKMLDHPQLFAAYPDLKYVHVGKRPGGGATYYPSADMIKVGEDVPMSEMRQILMHEIQHAIQHREGFATGGSAEANFTGAIKEAVSRMEKGTKEDVEGWEWAHALDIKNAEEAAEVSRYGLMYESMKRLRTYANSDRPSSVFRLIRNEMQWTYDERFRGDQVANELHYKFYDIPKRHKMRERNQYLSDMAWSAADWIESNIPAEMKTKFDNDPRTMKGMLRALEREASKARKALMPLTDLRERHRAAKTLQEASWYKSPHNIYRSLAGEVEARNVEARLKMTPEERADTSIRATEDVSQDETIVLSDSMEVNTPRVMMSEPNQEDRRRHLALRESISNMSPEDQAIAIEELRRLATTSRLTGLKNKDAFVELYGEDFSAEGKPQFIASIDSDALKSVNDLMGHQAGDALLKQTGIALAEELGKDFDAFHLSGDEFAVTGNDKAAIDEALKRAQNRLKGAIIKGTTPDGETVELHGLGFSYGIAEQLQEAEHELIKNKTAREETGERSARGELPGGVRFPGRQEQAGNGQPAPQISPENEAFIKAAQDESVSAEQLANMAKRDVQTWQATEHLAKVLGTSPDEVLKFLSRKIGTAYNAEQLHQAADILDSEWKQSQEYFQGLAKKLEGGELTDNDIVNLEEKLQELNALQAQYMGVRGEAGRALQIFRKLRDSTTLAESIQHVLDKHGGRRMVGEKIKALASLDPSQSGMRAVREVTEVKRWDQFMEWYINSLVSGIPTHVVNMTSNAMVSFLEDINRFVAAGIGLFHGGEKVTFDEAIAQMAATPAGAMAGFKAFSEAIKDETSPLQFRSKMDLPFRQAIPGKLGKVVRIPTRFLGAEDALFKTMAMTKELYALAARETGGDKAAMQRLIDNPPKEMLEKAWEVGQERTFTNRPGPIAAAITQLRNKHPAIGIILPFVRTPANIIGYALRHTPMAFAYKNVRDAMTAGGAKRDQALARVATGSSIGAAVIGLTAAGLITGTPPEDPNERRLWYAQGYQPNSLRIGDTWVSYSRLEPVGMLFGIAADMYKFADRVGVDEADKLATMLIGSISDNLMSKTYLRGLSDVMNAITDPERYGESWVSRLVTGVTTPVMLSYTAKATDEKLRRAENIMDSIKARLPGARETLEPKLDVFGEERKQEGSGLYRFFSPAYLKTHTGDPVARELSRLDVSMGMPTKKFRGVELSAKDHNDLIRTIGKPVYQVVRRIIDSPNYQRLPDPIKGYLLDKAISSVKRDARLYWTQQHPEIMKEAQQLKAEEFWERGYER